MNNLAEFYNPWALPDSFTAYNFAPEEIRNFLHPHWHSQKATHPYLYYVFGLYYVIIGNLVFAAKFKLSLIILTHYLYIFRFLGVIAIFGLCICLHFIAS